MSPPRRRPCVLVQVCDVTPCHDSRRAHMDGLSTTGVVLAGSLVAVFLRVWFRWDAFKVYVEHRCGAASTLLDAIAAIAYSAHTLLGTQGHEQVG